MASRLYAWARWVLHRRGLVIGSWLLLLAVVGGLGTTLAGRTSNEFTIPGIESQDAQDLLRERFPRASGAVARVVFATGDGTRLTEAAPRRALAAGLRKAADLPEVVAVSDPVRSGTVSRRGTIAYADVTFAEQPSDITEGMRDTLRRTMESARDAGLRVEFGGSAMEPPTEVGGPAEIVGLVVAVAVLALALGSLVAAGLPLVTAFVGVGIGVLGVLFLSRFVEMTGTATVLALMIGLAVGIDYALFIIARHREQLTDPATDVEESVARAVATAGSAVVFAGATVIVALGALCLAGIPFLTVMGLAAAGTVLLAVLVAISLVPAALGLLGERLRPRPRPSSPDLRGSAPGTWGLVWARAVTRAPVPVLLAGALGLLVLALPALDLRLGLPGNASKPAASTQHKSYDLLTRGFGAGFNATLTAVVDTTGIPAGDSAATVEKLRITLAGERGVAAVAPSMTNRDSTLAVIGVVPTTGPDEKATTDLVHRLREHAPAVDRVGGALYIAGTTAAAIDTSDKLSDALPLFVAVIVVLALVLLTAAFRSLLVPLKAVLGFLLSIAAALGATVWVFQDGHLGDALSVASAGPVVSFLPVLLIGVLFGLAMDYEVFLVSRMREHYEHTGDAAGAITHGLARSGRVICAAALIMVAVFAGFIFNDDPIIKPIGFALAFGVAVDAFVVRMTLVPAVLSLLGRHAWYLPRFLDRVIPDIDIEGAGLRATAAPERAALLTARASPEVWEHDEEDDGRFAEDTAEPCVGPAARAAGPTSATMLDGLLETHAAVEALSREIALAWTETTGAPHPPAGLHHTGELTEAEQYGPREPGGGADSGDVGWEEHTMHEETPGPAGPPDGAAGIAPAVTPAAGGGATPGDDRVKVPGEVGRAHRDALRAAAAVASARLICHRDTWAFLLEQASSHRHFRLPDRVTGLDDTRDGQVEVFLSGRSLLAVLTALRAVLDAEDEDQDLVTWALADALYQRARDAVTAAVADAGTSGEDTEIVTIVLDVRPAA
ncbi:hypothetical protein GCM10010145_22270 [Streptomyces ruber]|uniref:SSD domain-containing protein n=2 Tax=Streptomyces TaxID=1883 RepID=A0A918EQT4_9ACTN|nr:MMPL family transporter [Streptomyces ruber]GGQ52402.1 hypothetical protein GCM10010145_22270 [Streptomyces ruber]